MSDSNDGEINFVLYHYTPSIVAAIIFVVLFALGFFGHVFYIFKLRARYFIPFTIGVLREFSALIIYRTQLTRHSRMSWIRWTCSLTQRQGSSRAFHHAKSSDSRRTCTVRSLDLHGSRSHHPPS